MINNKFYLLLASSFKWKLQLCKQCKYVKILTVKITNAITPGKSFTVNAILENHKGSHTGLLKWPSYACNACIAKNRFVYNQMVIWNYKWESIIGQCIQFYFDFQIHTRQIKPYKRLFSTYSNVRSDTELQFNMI